MSDLVRKQLILTVDVEGEWYGLPGEQGYFDLEKIQFAVESLELLFMEIELNLGVRVPITWFIRCDNSVSVVTGRPEGLLHKLDKFIDRRLEKGDDFGFHPHLYKFDGCTWSSEMEPQRQQEQLVNSALAWKRYFGCLPSLSRMGEAAMNNLIADTISELGIKIDSSALPGRARTDNGFNFDWETTSKHAYFPSRTDYRIPAGIEGLPQNFLEAPFAMLPTKCSYDQKYVSRYLNLAFKSDVFLDALSGFEAISTSIAVLHPHELLNTNRPHPLISYDPKTLYSNIKNLENNFGGLNFNKLSSLIRV